MAKYTMSIEEIIQGKAQTQDVLEPEELYSIAKDVLFGDEINVIDEKYRKHLITAFTYHYWLDEIGQETFGRWRMRLISKLFENAAYINGIYENIDKVLFDTYHVTKVEKASNVSSNNSEQADETKQNESINNVRGSKESLDESSQNDNLQESSNGSKNYSENVSSEGQERAQDNSSSSSSSSDNYKDTSNSDGTETGSYRDTNHELNQNRGTTKNDANAISIAYSTPQGTLANMMNPLQVPGENGAGVGVAYATDGGHVYNYMSSAGENDSTSIQTDNTDATRDGYSERTFNDYHDLNESETNHEGSAEQSGESESITVKNNSSADEKSGESSDSSSHQSQRTVRDSKTGNETTASESTTNDNGASHLTKSGEMTSESNETSDVVDYVVSYEMLAKSESLVNKIWEVFDPLFMCIY